MSSPSAADVVRRRSVKISMGVSLQIGMRNGSRHTDARVEIASFRSLGLTTSAPGNVSDATSMESGAPRTVTFCAFAGTTHSARRDVVSRSRRADIRTDGVGPQDAN